MEPAVRGTLLAPLGRARVLAGFGGALVLPLLLELAIFAAGNSLLVLDVLFQLTGVIAVALIGGLWPALLAALWSSIVLNYTSTEPVGSLEISDPENIASVLVFVVVAVTVSFVVGLSARRSREAALAHREAELLGELARGALAEEDTLQGFLRHVQAQFDLDAVALFSGAGTEARQADPQDPDAAGPVPGPATEEPSALVVRPVVGAPDGFRQGEPAGGKPARGKRVGGKSAGSTPAVATRADAGTGKADRWTLAAATSVEPVDTGVSLALYGRQLSTQERGLVTAFGGQLRSLLQRQELLASTRTNQRLVEGNVMRTAILRSVSHDLRTPLAGIKLAVSSLRHPGMSFSREDEDEFLATIEDYSDRLNALVSNLLDMSRISGDAVNPYLRPVTWAEVVEPAFPDVPVDRIRVHLPANLPAVDADPVLLERVLANIIENAVKYAPDAPIEVTASVGGTGRALVHGFPAGELRVVDHGSGVSRADIAAMFRPFQRLDDAPSGAGVGLGLAVAKGFTEVMGGVLDAEETPGGGLTLVIRLPLSTGAAVQS